MQRPRGELAFSMYIYEMTVDAYDLLMVERIPLH